VCDQVNDASVDASQHHQSHLPPEERFAKVAQRLRPEQGDTGDDHEDEADHLPRQQARRDLRDPRAEIRDPDQAQIHHQDQAKKQAHRDDVRRQEE
jgi:hypothetical protein